MTVNEEGGGIIMYKYVCEVFEKPGGGSEVLSFSEITARITPI